MAAPNYKQDKKRREAAQKKKREDKEQRAIARKSTNPTEPNRN